MFFSSTIRFFINVLVCLSILCFHSRSQAQQQRTALIELPLKLKNPELTTDFMSFRVFPLIYRRLFRYKPGSNFSQQLEADVIQSYSHKNLKSFHFLLKEGVFFHDKTPINARAVGKILHLYQESKQYKETPLARITQIQESSALRLTVIFKQPEPYFLEALTSVMLFRREKTENIGSGPMKVTSQFANETVLEEIKNPQHKILLRYLNDEVLRYYQLSLGIADATVSGLGTSKTSYLLKKTDQELKSMHLKLVNSPSVALQYLGMNIRTPFLSNLQNRRCLVGSIHFEQIAKARLAGTAEKANTILSPLSENHILPEKEVKSAKTCAGFLPSTMLTLITPSDLHYLDLAKLVAYQIEKMGIQIKVQPMEMGFYLKALKEKEFDLFLGRVPFTLSPLNYAFLVQEGGYLDRIGAEKKKFEELYLKIIHEPSIEKRKKYISQFESKLVTEELLLAPLWFWNNIFIGKDTLNNIKLYPNWDLTTLLEMKGTSL